MISTMEGSRAAKRGRFLDGPGWRLALRVRLAIEEPGGSGDEGMSITCIGPLWRKEQNI